ncbi:chemotaxis protein [Desulfovibrio inopinatus]|uniref:chemotaxis protein n=1 Tax=Desulfovibrio inopinatus TaxID=102109 RepID=UPI000407D4DC|nr:chemotaxis protein [Desulfovibrio inopinatus]
MTPSDILLESGTNELEIIEFLIKEIDDEGKEHTGHYGVNVAKVLEIIRLPRVTALPGHFHPAVMGTFNMRNNIIALIDLCAWLGKTPVETDTPKVIVTEFNRVVNAFLVSGVTRIYRLSWERIEPPDINMQTYAEGCITGVVRMEDRILFILDMEKIIADLNPNLAVGTIPPSPETSSEAEVHYKTLIADDSSTIRHMIGHSLETAGFEVERTINGKMAWDKLMEWKERAVQNNRPISDYVHLVVSDIEMPAMDGHTLTKKIKDDPFLSNIPVILFSSLITEGLRHKGESVGADDQISKPELAEVAIRAKMLADKHWPT